jgi:DNA-binding transcriptional LysR family regulator
MGGPLLEDLQALLCFARVVEHASFTRAAHQLGVSKSLVSSKTSALEARLGEQLLLRTTRRVTTTSAGVRIYALARQMLDAAGAATQATTLAAHGVLRVSAPVTLSHEQLAQPFAAFLREHPGVRIELMPNDRLVDLVEERIDLALRVTKLKDSGLIARRLAMTSLHVCAAPSYLALRGRPDRPEDLERHDCLRYALLPATHEWRLYGPKGKIELSVRGCFESTSGTMLREAALAGIGLAMLPRFMVAAALAEGRLVTVLDDFAPRPLGIYAVRSGRRAAPPLVKRLIDSLENAFAKAPWSAPAHI